MTSLLPSKCLPRFVLCLMGQGAMEVVDDNLLKFLDATTPNRLKGIVDKPFPKLIVLIEFDQGNARVQKRMAKKVTKILSKAQIVHEVETDEFEKERLWKIRHSAAAVVAHSEGNTKALPIIEDDIVPVEVPAISQERLRYF